MLPEAVRLLHLLVTNGKRVYVHCTAGINRATLTTVGYLTFVKVCCFNPQPLGFASLFTLSNACINFALNIHLLVPHTTEVWQENCCVSSVLRYCLLTRCC